MPGVLPSPLLHPWQRELRRAVRDADQLCRRLGLAPELARQAEAGSQAFQVFVPQPYLARIVPGDPQDPLLRQVLPAAAEAESASGFSLDPVGDEGAQLTPGVLQKYHGRVLLVVSGACPVHCRYCFRRHYPYHDLPRGDQAWDAAIEAIEGDPSIREVILSGGDPLMQVDQVLERLTRRLAAIKNLKRLRIHTRLPIMIPTRICDELLGWLTAGPWTPIVAIHANHPRELDDEVAAACGRLRRAGVLLLNQAVLLRGVNADVATQCALSERLIEIGVAPYYLHQLDRVAGAAHFETSVAEGRQLMREMSRRLPGYAVPRYVREVPGAPAKMPL